MRNPTTPSRFSVSLPLPPPPTALPVDQLPLELVSAARTILDDLRRLDVTLGGAYDRALVAAAEGDSTPAGPLVVAALESGRQATRQGPAAPKTPRGDAPTTMEIITLRRFRAAGREFEPDQRYRLTALEFAEVEWRAALEPHTPLFRPATP